MVGVKTGYIGDVSGYCLVSGYLAGESTVTVAVMGAPSRASSFGDSENLIKALQERLKVKNVVTEGDEVGHYESWWTGKVPIVANESKEDVMYGDFAVDLEMSELSGELTVASEYDKYTVPVVVKEEFTFEPTFWQRFWRVFGWENKK